MKENRRNPRVKANAIISFSMRSSGLTGDSQVIDISEGGLCIPSVEFLPVDSLLEVEIRSDDLKEPIKALARVIRVTQKQTGKFQFEVGLEILELPYAKWHMLHDYILYSQSQE